MMIEQLTGRIAGRRHRGCKRHRSLDRLQTPRVASNTLAIVRLSSLYALLSVASSTLTSSLMGRELAQPKGWHGICICADTPAAGTTMMTVMHQWLDSLNEVERDLRSQGYVVVYGAAGSFVIPVCSDRQPPGRGRFRLWELLQMHPA
jgi:hypothetical protein